MKETLREVFNAGEVHDKRDFGARLSYQTQQLQRKHARPKPKPPPQLLQFNIKRNEEQQARNAELKEFSFPHKNNSKHQLSATQMTKQVGCPLSPFTSPSTLPLSLPRSYPESF